MTIKGNRSAIKYTRLWIPTIQLNGLRALGGRA